MDDDLVEQMLMALIEDFSLEELQNKKQMLIEIKTLFSMEDRQALALIDGALEIKTLREGYIPDWQQLFILH